MSGDTKKPGDFFSDPTRRAPRPDANQDHEDPLRGATRRVTPAQPEDSASAGGAPGLTPATRLWRPGQEPVSPVEEGTPSTQQAADDFVVGWLVVVHGPGQGTSLPLGYGLNGIGRGEEQRVCLNFGDEEISRNSHCSVAYDGRNRKFFIQHGGGQNLTYVGENPVLAAQELDANAMILIGSTRLQFVPFCGTGFDWADLSTSDAS